MSYARVLRSRPASLEDRCDSMIAQRRLARQRAGLRMQSCPATAWRLTTRPPYGAAGCAPSPPSRSRAGTRRFSSGSRSLDRSRRSTRATAAPHRRRSSRVRRLSAARASAARSSRPRGINVIYGLANLARGQVTAQSRRRRGGTTWSTAGSGTSTTSSSTRSAIPIRAATTTTPAAPTA